MSARIAPFSSNITAKPVASRHLRRAVLWILAGGFLLRLLIAFGLHEHLRDANPPHLWPQTDEVVYFDYGLKAAETLEQKDWPAFIDSTPSMKNYNWMHYRYTGLLLFLFDGSPLALRLTSSILAIAGILLFVRTFQHALSEQQLLFFSAMLAWLPSFAFWSALAIKEGVMLFLTAGLCWGIRHFWRKGTLLACLAWMSAVCLIIGGFRIWTGLGFFCAAVPLILLTHPGRPSLPAALVLTFAIMGSLWFIPNVHRLICEFVLHQSPDDTSISNPEFEFTERSQDLQGWHFPAYLKPFCAWVLPLPDAFTHSTLMKLASVENLLFLALTVLTIAALWQRHPPLEWIWIAFMAVLIVTAVVLGSNLGTIYRNKSAALPFLAYFAALGIPKIFRHRAKNRLTE